MDILGYKHGKSPIGSLDKIEGESKSGATSEVNIARDDDSYIYAYKNNCKDITWLSTINHPFFVKLFKTMKIDHKDICILEYCYALPVNIPDLYLKRLFVQFIFALAYLESIKISHGDLHDRNIMIGRDGFLRIIDFDKSNNIEDLSPNYSDKSELMTHVSVSVSAASKSKYMLFPK
jgi:serine/threonine protein kinase